MTHEASFYDPSRLKDLRVLVTGAGSGIGAAVARAFAATGARVGLLGRRAELLRAVRDSLAGGEAASHLVLPADVTDRRAVEAAVQSAAGAWGGIDVAVNNAGTNTPRRTVGEILPEEWDRVVAVNLTGVYNVVRAVLPHFRAQGRGTFVIVGSTAALRTSTVGGAAYCASKHGVRSLAESIHLEECERGVRSIAIHPGEVDTPILDKRPEPVAPEHRRRILKAEDVARAVLFACAQPGHVLISELVIKPLTQTF